MKKLFSILIVFFFFITLHALAQGPSVAEKSLVWSGDHLLEKHSNQEVTLNVTISTNANQSVVLAYPGQTLNFAIQSIDGTWQDENNNGSLTYHVTYNNESNGLVTVTRNEEGITIEFDFTAGNEHGLHQVFYIDSVQTN